MEVVIPSWRYLYRVKSNPKKGGEDAERMVVSLTNFLGHLAALVELGTVATQNLKFQRTVEKTDLLFDFQHVSTMGMSIFEEEHDVCSHF
jgi:hypothetical protein